MKRFLTYWPTAREPGGSLYRPGMTNAATGGGFLLPRAAAALLGVSTHTLADWADAGILRALVTPGGHRRYPAAEVRRMIEPGSVVAGRNHGAAARRGRPLTESEVNRLANEPDLNLWAALAAGYQADGSSIRQIAAAAGMKPATVAARITRAGRNA